MIMEKKIIILWTLRVRVAPDPWLESRHWLTCTSMVSTGNKRRQMGQADIMSLCFWVYSKRDHTAGSHRQLFKQLIPPTKQRVQQRERQVFKEQEVNFTDGFLE